MPNKKVFIDNSVLIRSFIYEESNSSIIIDLIVKGELKGFINSKVITETLHVLKLLFDKDSVSLAFSLIHSLFEIIPLTKYEDKMKLLRTQIKEKDLEHLATVRALQIKYLIVFDRDFNEIKEYITPTKFLQAEGIQAYETEC